MGLERGWGRLGEVREEELAVVRLFQHLTPLFNAYSRPEEVMACRYVQSSG
jgi:hypothetical protein